MQLFTTRLDTPYYPDAEQPSIVGLGLNLLDENQWMDVDNDLPQFIQHKKTLYSQYPDKVYFSEPDSVEAQKEFHQLVGDHLVKNYSTIYRADTIGEFTSLWDTSLLVQEDICLLTEEEGAYHLKAASVCSPSNWFLEKKRNKNLDIIHQPVPGYEQELSERVNKLFTKLKTDSPIVRFNWSLQPSNELFWRSDMAPSTQVLLPHWYWRVERQTLYRLPHSRAIVFGIRIYLHDIAHLQGGNFETTLHQIVKRLPASQQQYKGLSKWLDQFSN